MNMHTFGNQQTELPALLNTIIDLNNKKPQYLMNNRYCGI